MYGSHGFPSMPYTDCPSGVQKVICFSPCVPILDVAQVGNSQVVQERKEIDHQSVLDVWTMVHCSVNNSWAVMLKGVSAVGGKEIIMKNSLLVL